MQQYDLQLVVSINSQEHWEIISYDINYIEIKKVDILLLMDLEELKKQ